MKKIILTIAILTIAAITLTSCAGNAQTGTQAASVPLSATYTNAASAELQLIIGTIKLEGTENAVSAEQASELIPLWTLLKTLESKDSTASQEITAVVEKIASVMTTDQVKLISAMKITQQDAMSIMQGQTGKNSSVQINSGGPGGPPSDAFGGGPGLQVGQSVPSATTTAQKTQSGNNNSSPALLDMLIKLLQKKVQS